MWADVWADGPELGWIDGDGTGVRFSTGQVLPCPAGYLRCARALGVTAVVGQGTDSKDVIVVNDAGVLRRLPGPAHGAHPVLMRTVSRRFEVTYLTPDTRLHRVVLEPDTLDVIEEMESAGINTSQGFLGWRDGQLSYTDVDRIRRIGDVTLGVPQTDGIWTVAQHYDGPEIVAVHEPTGTIWLVSPDARTPVNPHIATADDGRALVAICSQPPQFVSSAAFMPFRRAQTVVTVPDFAPAPIACVPFDGPLDAPRIVGPGESVEGDIRYVLATVNREPPTAALAFAPLVRAQGLMFLDDPIFSPSRVPPGGVMGVQCYPDGKMSDGSLGSLEVCLWRLEANVTTAVESQRPFALVVPVYSGSGEWPVPYVLAVLDWCWTTAARLGVDVVPFGIIRAPREPEFAIALSRMLAAALGKPAPIHTQPDDEVEEDEPMPQPLEGPAKDAAIRDLGVIVAKYHGIDVSEGQQGIREAIDALPTGSAGDWMALAGARAHGATAPEREAAAAVIAGRLRR